MTNKITFPAEYLEIIELIENTDTNVFITGGAGTGKSTLLRHIIETTEKAHVVLAPTGIAAINIGGQTIHSFFKFSISLFDIASIKKNRNSELFESLEMIIIDEISMVRVDILEAIDKSLKINRNNSKPFGGLQMIFVGDVFQLPPVLTAKDNDFIFQNYRSHYFFDAPCLNTIDYQLKELTKIFRQDDTEKLFKETLNRIRIGGTTEKDISLLNSRLSMATNNDTIFLTTQREIAADINTKKLNSLTAKSFTFTATVYNAFDTTDVTRNSNENYPAPFNLVLKEGSQVMFLRNDKQKRWVNGTIGYVQKLTNNSISVKIKNTTFGVMPETWEQIEYKYNSTERKIEKNVVGQYTQYPLQLAYAITIHKSQGMTFDTVNINIGNGAFTHGQVYVALSRCKTLNGINLETRIDETDIIVDPRVLYFYKTKINPDFKLSSLELHRLELEILFKIRLDEALQIMSEEYQYEASILKKMVSQLGVRNAIRKLVNSPIPNKGLYTLQSKGAMHLSMEALVLEDSWLDLFTETDRENARRRLTQLGYKF